MPKANVFLSYSRKDYNSVATMFPKLVSQIKSLTINGQRYSIQFYWDNLNNPGDHWDDTIKWKMKEADVIIFFVTKSFLNSDYIQEFEIPIALNRKEESGIHLLPVLIEECEYQISAIKHLQFIASYQGYLVPMMEWPNGSSFWEYLVLSLKMAIKNSILQNPSIFYFEVKSYSSVDQKKHFKLFAPPDIQRLVKSSSKKKKKTVRKPVTLLVKIKKFLKKRLKF